MISVLLQFLVELVHALLVEVIIKQLTERGFRAAKWLVRRSASKGRKIHSFPTAEAEHP